MPKTKIETYTGHYIDLTDPDPAAIHLEDIAVQLSNLCRFSGAVTRFYSVAEHAVRVSKIAQRVGADYVTQMLCLHHDSHEAYMGDITTPLKTVIAESAPGVLDGIADRLDIAIYDALDLQPPTKKQARIIRAADLEALYREAAALKYSHGRGEHWGRHEYVRPYAGLGWDSARAEQEFVKRHTKLAKQLAKQ